MIETVFITRFLNVTFFPSLSPPPPPFPPPSFSVFPHFPLPPTHLYFPTILRLIGLFLISPGRHWAERGSQ